MKTIAVKDTQLQEAEAEPRASVWPSDVSTILGLNPYTSPLELWMVQTGRQDRADLSEIESVQWGKRLEPVIAQAYTEKYGIKVRRLNRTITHPRHAWWRGRIDYQLLNQDERTLLEVKNASEYQRGKWGEDGSDSVPDYYAVQVHAYMPMNLGFDHAKLAVLIGGNTLRQYHLERDSEMDELIEARLIEWHYLLLADRVPAPMSVSDLEMLWPQHIEDCVEATEDVLADISRLKQINGSLKELGAAKDEISDRIKMFTMGKGFINHAGAVLATYKTVNQKRLDQSALKAGDPAIFAQYEKAASYRALRVK